jgi:hypothetical protein
MCTVSIIALGTESGSSGPRGGFRVVCNRDEIRSRPPATPPEWRIVDAPGTADWQAGAVQAIWPTDTAAGGTWIAAAESGLVLCLLNLNPDAPPVLPPEETMLSRGSVIPSLIGARDAEAAARGVASLELDRMAPFRLVAVAPVRRVGAHAGAHLVNGLGDHAAAGPLQLVEVAWDLRELRTAHHEILPACFVSSGLGDSKVLGRLDLFAELVARAGADCKTQNEFHRHTWPEAPELSVMMAREDARTVSVTSVEVLPGADAWRVAMTYKPVAENLGAARPARVGSLAGVMPR